MVRQWWLLLLVGLAACGLIAMMAVTAASDLDDNTAVLVRVIGTVSIIAIFVVWFGAWYLGLRLQRAIDELSATQSDLHQLFARSPCRGVAA